ncbi:6c795d20-73e7-4945-b38a-c718f640e96b [Sclerotinia trifoliorum]|uniref:6c795d20-73e7-4945-b38a-c718f640e96b n=1 Tax=Sclerotinia trifoliorum TaxID=28548 RepID=A0A8H2W259_9HELO|nr:6c795d20-73e7-4945-b38a-c718f640e96b [Sclerotinia trifoliorum]
MSTSMLPPGPKTKHSKDDDYLRQQWAKHLNTQYENDESSKAGEDAVVERIVARAGGDGKNTNKEQIEETYSIIKRRTDPTSLRATVEQEYIVAEAGKHFAKYGVSKPSDFGAAQHRIFIAQKALIDDIVSKYGEKYKELSAIGSVYLLYKRPYPEAEDYLVNKWMSYRNEEFGDRWDSHRKGDRAEEDIKHCFGVVKNRADIERWCFEHAKGDEHTLCWNCLRLIREFHNGAQQSLDMAVGECLELDISFVKSLSLLSKYFYTSDVVSFHFVHRWLGIQCLNWFLALDSVEFQGSFRMFDLDLDVGTEVHFPNEI